MPVLPPLEADRVAGKLAPRDLVPPPFKPARLTPPDKFYGDLQKFRTFLTQCSLHFLGSPTSFPTDQSKVLFLISNLGGNALAWATPLVEQVSPLLRDYAGFTREFRNIFEQPAVTQTISSELLTLRQGGKDLQTYLITFRHLSSHLAWTDQTLFSIFLDGLRDDLRDAVTMVYPMPTTLARLIDLTLQMDHRLRGRRGESHKPLKKPWEKPTERPVAKPATSPPAVKEEPPSGARVKSTPHPPLTEGEWLRLWREGLCLYCGKAGHTIKDCKLRPVPVVSVVVPDPELEDARGPTPSPSGNDLAQI